jgi:NAD(P)-dependent dehydrogenase (short-subunit alcohol dehydrogenase family)
LNALFSQIQNRFGHLDVAVNDASPANPATGQYASVDAPALAESLMADFRVRTQWAKQKLNLMRAGGSIVNISSVNGLRPTPNAAMYSAAKQALEGRTRSVALEAIQDGIRIYAVAPDLDLALAVARGSVGQSGSAQ